MGSSFAARVGTTLGPHGMHATEQPARRHTQRSPCRAGPTWTDVKPHFLGVKGSPVHVRDTGSRESTTGPGSRGVAWSSPAGPGGGVENGSGEG
jgi:hypothetical protein